MPFRRTRTKVELPGRSIRCVAVQIDVGLNYTCVGKCERGLELISLCTPGHHEREVHVYLRSLRYSLGERGDSCNQVQEHELSGAFEESHLEVSAQVEQSQPEQNIDVSTGER